MNLQHNKDESFWPAFGVKAAIVVFVILPLCAWFDPRIPGLAGFAAVTFMVLVPEHVLPIPSRVQVFLAVWLAALALAVWSL